MLVNAPEFFSLLRRSVSVFALVMRAFVTKFKWFFLYKYKKLY